MLVDMQFPEDDEADELFDALQSSLPESQEPITIEIQANLRFEQKKCPFAFWLAQANPGALKLQ